MSSDETTRSSFLVESIVASASYVAASLITFKVIAPVQNLFFPQFPSHASLLFLPHGVRVVSAWLLGWRAVPALLPGVVLVFFFVGGMNILLPSRIAAIAIAVSIAPAVFDLAARTGWNVFPGAGRRTSWPGVMALGVVISLLNAVLTNFVLATGFQDFFAYLIGDVFGLFFMMLILMFAFRFLRQRENSATSGG